METDLGQQLFSEGIETPDGSLFLRVADPTLDLPRWAHKGGQVGCGIGFFFSSFCVTLGANLVTTYV